MLIVAGNLLSLPSQTNMLSIVKTEDILNVN